MLGRRSHPEVGSAAANLRDALAHLASAATRWLTLQPASQGLYTSGERLRTRGGQMAGDVSGWAADAAHDVGDAAARARRGTRRLLVNAILVALLGYYMDWVLSQDSPDR